MMNIRYFLYTVKIKIKLSTNTIPFYKQQYLNVLYWNIICNIMSNYTSYGCDDHFFFNFSF